MSLLITDAGIAASIRAGELGISYKIAEISIGTEGYIPNKDQTNLRNEVQRKAITRGEVTALGQLHFETTWDGSETFEGKELGYWLDDGTLFAVDSRDGDVITYKQQDSAVTEACELNLAASTIENITVEVLNPYSATEDRAGIAKITTNEQVEEGTDDHSFLTVKKLAYALGVPHIIDKLVSNLWLKLAAKILPVGAPIPWMTDIAPDGFAIMKDQAFDMDVNTELAKVFTNGIIPDMRGCGVIGKEDGETVGAFAAGQVKEHGHPNSTVSSTNLGSKNSNNKGAHKHNAKHDGNASGDGPYFGDSASTKGARNVQTESAGDHVHSVAIGSHAHAVVIALFGALKNTIDHRKVNWIVRMA
ncbi:phage tail protein [Vibrio sp. SCSIO 43133]|uniref:phage tail protein n=1 Tax=Vibrio sp. SCSIO 43133 TaxID=2802577 RepID=UPI0020759128|nr:phage tail protein [Vibrio sp. SCSIO 43133]USE02733.1 phage tail protein [Vibrio sp. SCSIO 43133]